MFSQYLIHQIRLVGGLARDLICCNERGRTAGTPQNLALAGATPWLQSWDTRKLSKTFDNSNTVLVIEYAAEGEDSDAFDKAFSDNDLHALAKLLSSTEIIDSLLEPKHPWAEDPKTVGALAAMYLARLASEVVLTNPGIKDEIRKAGAIPPLVDLLRSSEQDRIQTAVVTLRYLTDESSGNAAAAYKEGAMPPLIECLRSPVGGLRGAAASTLRNIYLINDNCRKAFVSLGGVEVLVKHLDFGNDDDDAFLNQADVQYEAVCNLEDLIEDDDGNIIQEYARCVVSFGARDKLEKLRGSEDEDLKASAEKVYNQLEVVA